VSLCPVTTTWRAHDSCGQMSVSRKGAQRHQLACSADTCVRTHISRDPSHDLAALIAGSWTLARIYSCTPLFRVINLDWQIKKHILGALGVRAAACCCDSPRRETRVCLSIAVGSALSVRSSRPVPFDPPSSFVSHLLAGHLLGLGLGRL